MPLETYQPKKSLALLDEELERLLGFLRDKEEQWVQCRLDDLSGLSGQLEAHVRQLSSAVSDLRCTLQTSGHATVREWQQSESTSPRSGPELSESLRAKI